MALFKTFEWIRNPSGLHYNLAYLANKTEYGKTGFCTKEFPKYISSMV
jgi:hypothetical protein